MGRTHLNDMASSGTGLAILQTHNGEPPESGTVPMIAMIAMDRRVICPGGGSGLITWELARAEFVSSGGESVCECVRVCVDTGQDKWS
jgi:hypothetical protein